MYLDEKDMGIILPDQLNNNFVTTTLTSLDEIDVNVGVTVACGYWPK